MGWLTDVVEFVVQKVLKKQFLRKGAVSGTLVNNLGEPISGAIIIFSNNDEKLTSLPTSLDGSFSIPDVYSSYNISVEVANDLHSNLKSVFISEGEHVSGLQLVLSSLGMAADTPRPNGPQSETLNFDAQGKHQEFASTTFVNTEHSKNVYTEHLAKDFIKKGSSEQREFIRHIKHSLAACENYCFAELFCGVYLTKVDDSNASSCIGFTPFNRMYGGDSKSSILVVSSLHDYGLSPDFFLPVEQPFYPIMLMSNPGPYVDSKLHWEVKLTNSWFDPSYVEESLRPIFDYYSEPHPKKIFALKTSKKRRKEVVNELSQFMHDEYNEWANSHNINVPHKFKTYQSRDGKWTCSFIDWRKRDMNIAIDIGIKYLEDDNSHFFYLYLISRTQDVELYQLLENSGISYKLRSQQFKDSTENYKISFQKEVPLTSLSVKELKSIAVRECKNLFPIISELFSML